MEHETLRGAVRRFRRVITAITTASELSATRAGEVSRLIRDVLRYAGPRRYALERLLQGAEVGVPKGESKQAARRAIQRLEAWRERLSAPSRGLGARAASS